LGACQKQHAVSQRSTTVIKSNTSNLLSANLTVMPPHLPDADTDANAAAAAAAVLLSFSPHD
jgi:hypothetical protein